MCVCACGLFVSNIFPKMHDCKNSALQLEPPTARRMDDDTCANHTLGHVESLVVARGLTAAVSSSLTTAAVIYISVQQSFRTTLQRLVLALTAATAVNLLAMTLQIHVGSVKYCAATGFLVQYTASVAVILVIGTVIYLWQVIRTAGQLRHSHTPPSTSLRMESLFYLLSLLLPLSINWFPFLGHHYGRAGAWCWITGCTHRGLLYQILLGYFPTTLTCLLTSSLVAAISCRYCRWAHQYRLQRQVLLIEAAEISLLLLYLLCYAVFSVFELAFGVVVRRGIVKEYWLHMTYAITKPLLLALVPLSLLLYLYSTRRAVKKMMVWCSCQKSHTQRGTHTESETESEWEKKSLLGGNKEESPNSGSAVIANYQPSIVAMNDDDDDPLYSTTTDSGTPSDT